MDSGFSCLLLTSVLVLALGTEEQRKMLTIATSPQTAGSSPTAAPDPDCSPMFDEIGPFCQYVYHYPSEFSSDTNDICMDLMHKCGSLDGTIEDICLSRLTSACADSSQDDFFFMEYCGMVKVVCPRGFDRSASASGDSGSAESEGRSFSESDSGTFSASGNSGRGSGSSEALDAGGNSGEHGGSERSDSGIGSAESGSWSADISGKSGQPGGSGQHDSGSGSAKVADISGSSRQSGSGSGSGQSESGGSPEQPNDETMLILSYTAIASKMLVNIGELSEFQRDDVITIVFRGLNEEQFIGSGIELFRTQIAKSVNTYLSNKGNNRQKRQQTPLTPEDVLIVEPLVEDQGRLQVAVIVGGEGGQSTPISGSELSSLLQANGQQLAADLGAVSGSSVKFAGIISTKSLITTTSPTTPWLSPTGAVIIQSTVDHGRQQQRVLLLAGAIAGVVIGALFVVMLSLFLITAAVASFRAQLQRQQYKMRSEAQSNKYFGVPIEGDSEFISTWQPLAEGNNYQAVPVSDEI